MSRTVDKTPSRGPTTLRGPVGRVLLVGLLAAGVAIGVAALQDRSSNPAGSPGFAQARARMVDEQIRRRGIHDPRVLEAMETVPRHLFVPPEHRTEAYEDHACGIGYGQTISQPYVVALMSSMLDLDPGDRVLEIGTGSAYHAAVLSRLASEVYTIEIVEPLAHRAERILQRLGYDNIHVRVGDGYRGWPEAAPFDGILLTAAPFEIPPPLLDQLATGGKLVAPVGGSDQRLRVVTRTAEGLATEIGDPVRFVPMTGEAQQGRIARPSAPPTGSPLPN